MACLALHDKAAPDTSFLALLPLLRGARATNANFVKKGVSWALRAIGDANLGAQRRRGDSGAAPGGLAAGRGAVGGKGRASRAHESRGDSATRGEALKRRKLSVRSARGKRR